VSAAPGESRSCVACDYEGGSAADRCPRCGEKMLGAESYRRRGCALVILGLFLVAFTGWFIIKEANRPTAPGALGSAVGDTVSPAPWLAFLGFFLFFGVVSIASGAWEMGHGRPNPKLRAIVLALFAVFMAVAGIASFFR